MSEYAPNDNNSNSITDKIPQNIKDEYNKILGKISDNLYKKNNNSDSNKINELNTDNSSNNKISLNAQYLDEDASHKAGENEHKHNLLTKSKDLVHYSKHILNSHNEMLNSDMRELDKIGEDIVTKNRLIEINNKESLKKNYRYDRNIAFSILILIIANIYLFNKHITLSIAKLVILTIILIIVYYLYITYLYNEHGLNEPKFKSPYDPISKKQIRQDLRKIRKDEFLKKQCDCPSTLDTDDTQEKQELADHIRRPGGYNKYGDKIKNNANNFYYDGTAPIQNKEMIFHSKQHKGKNHKNKDKQNFMIEWESSNHRAGIDLNKDQLDTLGINMEDTIERFANPLRAALPHPNLPYHHSGEKNDKNDEKELSCVETSSIGSIQSHSINKNKAYQLDKWMTPTSDL